MTPPNAENLSAWLVSRVAELRGIDPRAIDPRERFSRYGLDSLSATGMLAELAQQLGRPLAPTLVWEYPTIDALARFLTEGAPSASTPSEARVVPGVFDEPIALVGVACRFPKAPDVESYWRLLRDGVDAITETPKDRWDVHAFFDPDLAAAGKMTTRWGGYLDQVDEFDPQFFGISPREAIQMDPQQRLALELTWEALEDAGILPRSLRDSRTGVFMGSMWTDYARIGGGGTDHITPHTATGQDLSIIPARISYALGLRGPSLLVNTACSSSLVAVHLARQSLLLGESELALVGGVNLLLAPHSTVAMSKFGAMAPDGRSKAFDARANGYVRGEGGGIVILERLSRARALGHRVHALVIGSAVNNDGYSNGLTAPSPKAQELVLREAYASAGVDPSHVQYVETHGTGTMLGDPIEAGALGLALGEAHPPERPLLIGSVKTNIGHLEAAAGIAGLIKVVLSLRHRAIPPSLHFKEPNPHIAFDALRIKVQTALEPWPDAEGRTIAGVSSFGFGGTNCHVILEGVRDDGVHLVPLSAVSEEALHERAHWLREVATQRDQRPPIEQLAAALAAHLSMDPLRVALTVRSHDELADRLTDLLTRRSRPGVFVGEPGGRWSAPVFVFAGQGSQWVRMGRGLAGKEPAFRASLEQTDRAMRPHLGGASVLEILVGDDEAWLEDTALVQPAIFAVQVASAALLRAWGIEPAAVVGQSMGEVAAACVAGCLDLEDAARVICARSRIVKRASGRGAMAVVELGLEDARAAIDGREADLSVAVSASPSSTVLSGDVAALDAVLQTLEQRGIYCRKIKVDYASHCPQMEPLRDELLAALEGLRPTRGVVPFISTVTGEAVGDARLDGMYWWRNLREPVLFAPAVGRLLEQGHELFVDLDPHPLLARAIEQCAAHLGRRSFVMSTMKREDDETEVVREALGALYVRGARVEWGQVFSTGLPPLSVLQALGLELSSPPVQPPTSDEPALLLLSANGKRVLGMRALATAAYLRDHGEVRLEDVCYTAAAARAHLEDRVAICAASRAEMVSTLEAFAQGKSGGVAIQGSAPSAARRGLVFVFPGQGSQWLGMGKRLFGRERAFRVAIEECDAVIRRKAGFSVIEEMFAEEAQSRLGHIDVVQPMLFAIEVALAALWRAWGVEPDCVIGHSMGEIAAAHVAGVLSLEDAAKVICRRSKLLRRVAGLGAMALVELAMTDAERALDGYEDRLSVAVSNGPRSTVISGEPAALDEVLASLQARSVFCRRVKVDVASHSPQMDVLKPDLLDALDGIRPREARLPMRSTVTGTFVAGAELDPSYWVQNLRAPVLFGQAVATSIEAGETVFLEISPHPILLHSIEENLRALSKQGATVHSLKRDEDDRRSLVEALGALHVNGRDIAWARIFPRGGRVISLPAYPWQRDRYWLSDEARSRAPSSRSRWGKGVGRVEPDVHPLLGSPMPLSVEPTLHLWEQSLCITTLPYLAHHRVSAEAVFPGAGYVEMALAAVSELHGKVSVSLEEISFDRMLPISKDPERRVQFVLIDEEAGRATFHVSSRELGANTWTQHATGKVRMGVGAPGARMSRERPRVLQARCPTTYDTAAFYQRMEEGGLSYGVSFRGIEQLWLGAGEGLARVILRNDIVATLGSYQVHPALLDACFQVLVGIHVAGKAEPVGTYVLSGVDRLRIHRALGQDVWVHAQLHEVNDKANPAGDLFVIDADGRVLAEVFGLRMKRLESGKNASANALNDSVYGIEWRKKDLDIESTRPQPPRGPSAWLLFVDDGGTAASMAFLLLARGEACVRVRAGTRFARLEAGLYEIDPTNPEHYQRIMRDAFGREVQCRGILHLFSLDGMAWDRTTNETIERDIARGCMSALYLVQAVLRQGWRDMPRLWLVTRGAQAVHATGTPLSVAQSTLWGLGRTIALEHPELDCTRIDVDSGRSVDEASFLVREISARDREDQVAYRREGRFVARLVHSSFEAGESATANVSPEPANGRPFKLESLEVGALERLVLRESPRRPPGVGEVELEVEAAGLNYIDVMKAMAIYPGMADASSFSLGLECAGRVVAVGEGVENITVGQEVVAYAPGSFGSHVTTLAAFVAPKPARLSFAEAASIPVVFTTVYYALNRLARLGHDERVLIHTATGGTGLAAIQIARVLKAEIFATAGSEEKREYLRSIGIEHVMDSRTLSFANEVMEKTAGQGVDVVLNTLTGDARTKSLELLAAYGRFVELSKRDIYESSQLAMTPFRRSVSFASVDLPGMSVERPSLLGTLLNEVMQLFDMGIFQPLPVKVFPASQAKGAFELMAQAKHIGKVVLAMNEPSAPILPVEQPSPAIRPDATYLISGGLGGLGISLAGWMVEQGARHIALVGRNSPGTAARDAIQAMEKAGAEVAVMSADVSRESEVDALIGDIGKRMPPLRGVVHAAGLLDDRTLLELDAERFSRVLGPKVHGAWNLHAHTAGLALDFFTLYSSSASLLGAPGQGNYAAANAFLDALAHARRRTGLVATSIHWGPFADVGLAAAQDNRGKRLSHRGIESLTPAHGLLAFAKLLEKPRAEVGVLRLAVHQWIEFYPQTADSPYWSELQRDQKSNDHPPSSRVSFRNLLERRSPPERLPLLEKHILEHVGQVLRLDIARIDRLASFTSLGMDSLLSLELRNRLESSLGVRLSATLLFTYPNPASLADHLLDRMSLSTGKQRPTDTSPPSMAAVSPGRADRSSSTGDRSSSLPKPLDGLKVQTLRQMTQAEAELLLEEELARSEDYLT